MASTGLASTGPQHGPKLRSRKLGAATPLDDRDKRVLNLMQGSFPFAPRPYGHVAAEAGISEEEVLARVQRLLAERIIRQVTPIFDTRALGYSSMLVAAKITERATLYSSLSSRRSGCCTSPTTTGLGNAGTQACDPLLGPV
jgi:hypothetical protein